MACRGTCRSGAAVWQCHAFAAAATPAMPAAARAASNTMFGFEAAEGRSEEQQRPTGGYDHSVLITIICQSASISTIIGAAGATGEADGEGRRDAGRGLRRDTCRAGKAGHARRRMGCSN